MSKSIISNINQDVPVSAHAAPPPEYYDLRSRAVLKRNLNQDLKAVKKPAIDETAITPEQRMEKIYEHIRGLETSMRPIFNEIFKKSEPEVVQEDAEDEEDQTEETAETSDSETHYNVTIRLRIKS